MIPDCDGQTVRWTESIMAKTALCIASYADALSIKIKHSGGNGRSSSLTYTVFSKYVMPYNTEHVIISSHTNILCN